MFSGDPGGDCANASSISIGRDAPTPADATCERFRRRKRIAKMTMEIVAIPPTTPPAIAPEFEVLPFGGTGVGDGVPAELEDALAEDVDTTGGLAEDVVTVVSKIAPGPYSGLSI
jgi:hypothetical protein